MCCVPVKIEGNGVRANVRVEYTFEFVISNGARVVTVVTRDEGVRVVYDEKVERVCGAHTSKYWNAIQ